MQESDSVIAVFADQGAAEMAVRRLTAGGFMVESLSVLGKAYDRDEKVVGFYNTGGQVRFWGERGVFWGRMWSLFSGGLFVTVPVVGPVIVLGHLATTAMSAVEGLTDNGGMNAIGVALAGIGIPRDSAIQFEFAVKADGFVVMAHGVGTDIGRARAILADTGPAHLDTHLGDSSSEPIVHLAAVGS